MASIARRLSTLQHESHPAAAAFVADALGHCSDAELEPIIDFAVELGRPESLAAAIAVCHRLGPRGAARFRSAADLRPALAMLASRDEPQLLENLIAIAADRDDPRLLAAIVPGLEDETLAGPTAEAILGVTVAVLGATGRRHAAAGAVLAIDEAVAAAAEHYREHRRDEVLLAAGVALAKPMPALRRLLDDDDTAVGMSLRAIGDRLHEPLVRHNLVRWLGNDVLARSASRWLNGLQTVSDFEDVLADGHLLLAPRRRRAIRHADRPLRCLPEVAVATALPEREQAWVPVLAERLDLSSRARLAALSDCLALPSPVARLRAVSALLSMPRARAASALAAFAQDRHPAVARLAAQSELATGAPEPDDLVRLARAPHPAIARRARSQLARIDVHALVAEWPTLAPSARRAAVVAQLARDRDACLDTLTRLIEAGGDGAVAAIMTARRLRLAGALEPVMLATANGRDPKSASAAVGALADGRNTRRRALLHGALTSSAHPRVRANAADVLGAIGESSDADVLEPLSGSRDNRLRANAVRALFRLGDDRADDALRSMLRDRDPLHRLSAIWVARSVRAASAVRELHRLVASDPRREVRGRARRTVAAIDFWSPRAVPVESSL